MLKAVRDIGIKSDKIFQRFFKQRAKLEREIGASCINGVFLDELDPKAGNNQSEILEDCSLFCQLVLNETEVKE